jgi:peptide/nickel transport system permease protein
VEPTAAEEGFPLLFEPEGKAIELRKAVRRVTRNVGAMLGISMLLLLLLAAIFSSLLSPYSPVAIRTADHFMPPGRAHLFGTDEMGRDVFSRVLAGARISLRVVLIVLLVASTIGVPLGAIAGYWGGPIDHIIMRVSDVFLSFPSFILAMAITAGLGRSLEYAILSVGIVYWAIYARLIRGQVLSTKHEVYVDAARAIGASQFRVLFVHVLPNCIAPFIIQSSMHAGSAILATAGLSFVGLGAQPPTAEWGAMISNGRQFITTFWWVPTFPSLAISFTVAAYMFLGDGLRDLLDPRLQYELGR